MKRLHQMTLRRKWLIIGSISATTLIILGAFYVFLSTKAWSESRSAMIGQISSIDELSTKVNDKKVSAKDRREALESISAIDTNRTCVVSGLFSWQTDVVSSIQAQQEDCRSIVSTIKKVQTSSTAIVDYYNDEQSLIATLKGLASSKKQLTSKDFVAIIEKIKLAQKSLAAVSPKTDKGVALKEMLIKRVASVASAWSSVSAANKDENRSAYGAAQTKLRDAYEKFQDVHDESEENYRSLQADFSDASSQRSV